MKLSDDRLKTIFSEFDEENDPILYRIYGVIMATAGKMLLFGNFSALANQYFLVGFSNERMVMIRLGALGDRKETKIIPLHDIRSTQISSWMFGLGKKIRFKLSDGSKIRLKISKVNTALKGQKENLAGICRLLAAWHPV